MNIHTDAPEAIVEDRLPRVKKTLYTSCIKRLLDVIFSGAALIILSPLLLIIAVLELFFHGRPVFFAQERPGLHGKMFKLYKFRSMTNETDENGVLLPSEERLTSFGRLLRRFSFDELLEFYSIFTGKMSIIGPRPLLPEYLPLYTKRHSMRHEVRPGLACEPLWPLKTWTWNDQFETDVWYVENCSFWVDVKMIFTLAKETLSGSEYRVNDTREAYNGENLFSDAKHGGSA